MRIGYTSDNFVKRQDDHLHRYYANEDRTYVYGYSDNFVKRRDDHLHRYYHMSGYSSARWEGIPDGRDMRPTIADYEVMRNLTRSGRGLKVPTWLKN